MNDENNIRSQSEQSGCPSQDLLTGFVKGKLNEEDAEMIRDHLKSCDFCQDAVEGYSEMQDQTKIPFIVNELNQKIDEKAGINKKAIPLYQSVYFRVAAILIVLVFSVFILARIIKNPVLETAELVSEEEMTEQTINPSFDEVKSIDKKVNSREDKQLAQAKVEAVEVEEKEESAEVLIIEDLEEEVNEMAAAEDHLDSKGLELNPGKLQVPEAKEDAEETQEVLIEKKEALAETEKITNVATEENFGIFTNKSSPKKTVKDHQSKRNYAIEGYSDMPVDSSAVSLEFFIDGMSYYNAGDYSNSINYFSHALMWDPSNVDAACYAGVSNYNLKNYSVALAYFEQVLSQKKDPCFYQAKYLKAKTLIQLRKTEDARSILDELMEQENPYQSEAKVLLESLK
ncbi:MAG: tetratricopeptide repeat protein [Bacteroidetes bacterium]|nr:tetratricopeptide repeat protein [Bacteroidota bacterium]